MVNGWVTAGASQKEVAFQSALPAGVLLPPWVFALGALMWHSGINSATTL